MFWGAAKMDLYNLEQMKKDCMATIKLPNTQYAQDLYELVQRGDIDQASFGFNILDEDLEELSNGYRWRIKNIDLHEISVVTFPQYENTSVQARSKQIEQLKNASCKKRKMRYQKD